jgi:FAD-linked sulfhydryl oxidase
MPTTTRYLDPQVWGPHYWFFLHTLAMTYPEYPSGVTKKKYYELIQNFSLFIPIEKISGEFSKLVESYPVAPYLDNRKTFVKWTHFIHNKINEKLEKPQISLNEFYNRYYNAYKTKDEKWRNYYIILRKVVYLLVILLLSYFIFYFYDK